MIYVRKHYFSWKTLKEKEILKEGAKNIPATFLEHFLYYNIILKTCLLHGYILFLFVMLFFMIETNTMRLIIVGWIILLCNIFFVLCIVWQKKGIFIIFLITRGFLSFSKRFLRVHIPETKLLVTQFVQFTSKMVTIRWPIWIKCQIHRNLISNWGK